MRKAHLPLAVLGVVLFGLGQLCFSEGTNQVPTRSGVNPYTGRPIPRQGGYNPFMGTGGSQAPTRNPFTGQAPQVSRNPYTGAVVRRQPRANPWPQGQAPSEPSPQTAAWTQSGPPVTGRAGPGLEAFDQAILTIMNRHGIPGGALVIAKDGKLVYARGFGWADLATGEKVQPTTLFGLASLSKPITAMAVFHLVEEGKLGLDEPAFAYIKHIKPHAGLRPDPRIKRITIRQLLNHSGGWDRTTSGDPINWSPTIARTLRVPMPITAEQFLSYMLGLGLDFDPGTDAQYSNVGYIALGEIIATVSGLSYEEYVRRHVLAPMGIHQAGMTTAQRRYLPGEARSYHAGTAMMLPPMQLPMGQASGGWSISPVDMVRFLTAVDGSRGKPFLKEKTRQQMIAPPPAPLKPRKNGTYAGLGWSTVYVSGKTFGYFQDGRWYGMRTFMKRSPKGVNWMLAFNVNMQPDLADSKIIAAAVQEVRKKVEDFDNYPKIDLFEHFK